MVNHSDIVEILKEIGKELRYDVPDKRRRVISTVTHRSGKRSIIGYDPDVIWESSGNTAVFEVECGYEDEKKQQKYVFGTIALSLLHSKAERKKTWFYIVVDNEKIADQVFNFLHCINEHIAPTRGDGGNDFNRQIIVCPRKLSRDQLKRYLKKEMKKEGW